MTKVGSVKQNNAVTRCQKCLIHNRTICHAADPVSLKELNRISRVRHCEAGETIVAQGETPSIVGNVVEGVLKITKRLPDGREHIVGLLFPSDFFGRAFALDIGFSIEAATDATVCIMEQQAFEHVLDCNRDMERDVLHHTFDELDASREWMVLLGCQNTLERVASFFALLVQRSEKQCATASPFSKQQILRFPIGRQDIAAFIGTTVETLSRQIHRLSREKIIRILDSKHFEILDPERLFAYAGEEITPA